MRRSTFRWSCFGCAGFNRRGQTRAPEIWDATERKSWCQHDRSQVGDQRHQHIIGDAVPGVLATTGHDEFQRESSLAVEREPGTSVPLSSTWDLS